jgi:pilus assembly protein CpaF
MMLMCGLEMPLRATRSQIASAVHVVVQVSRLSDGTRRMTSIAEITGMEGDVVAMHEVFRFKRTGIEPGGRITGHFEAAGIRSAFAERFQTWGYDLPNDIYAPNRKLG